MRRLNEYSPWPADCSFAATVDARSVQTFVAPSTLPSSGDNERSAAKANGFSLHAGVVAAADERAKLERELAHCEWVAQPENAIAFGPSGVVKTIVLLRKLMRGRRKSVYLVLDSLPAHKTARVRAYVASTNDRLTLHFLPGNAPDLDPDELVRSHVKRTGVARSPL